MSGPVPRPGARPAARSATGRTASRWRLFIALGAAWALAAGCAGTPVPDWALDAHAAMQRSLAAALDGDTRIEAVEFSRARTQIARSGRTDLLARAELMRCAAHVARLDLGPCPGFEALRADASAADRAYAGYLAGQLDAAEVGLLPPQHQAVARGDVAALAAVADPMARLVAAAVLLQGGRATPATLAQAVDTASAQGWRRALLAWLQVQQRGARQAGDLDEVQRLQRRIDATGGQR